LRKEAYEALGELKEYRSQLLKKAKESYGKNDEWDRLIFDGTIPDIRYVNVLIEALGKISAGKEITVGDFGKFLKIRERREKESREIIRRTEELVRKEMEKMTEYIFKKYLEP